MRKLRLKHQGDYRTFPILPRNHNVLVTVFISIYNGCIIQNKTQDFINIPIFQNEGAFRSMYVMHPNM